MKNEGKYSIGIDLGSSSTKLVILNQRKEILCVKKLHSGIKFQDVGRKLIESALKETNLHLNNGLFIVSTGYGRKSVKFSLFSKTEIFCIAKGAYFLNNRARTIIDIGGQDVKVISLDGRGKVVNFVMNDRCAAGTGKFLEMISQRFDINLDRMGVLSLQSHQDLAISSTCAVFAESEAVSLVSRGEKIENILKGIHKALSDRVARLVGRVGLVEDILFCGGVAKNCGMFDGLKRSLDREIVKPAYEEYVGALGAALIGLDTDNGY